MRKQQVLAFSLCVGMCVHLLVHVMAVDLQSLQLFFRVMAVSNKEFRYGLQEDSSVKPPHPNIEQLKGTSATQWTMQCKGIQEQ